MLAKIDRTGSIDRVEGSDRLNLTVKKYENWSTFAEVIVKIKVARIFETRGKFTSPTPLSQVTTHKSNW